MQTVIVQAAVEAGENHLAPVHRRIELQITIHIRVNNEIGRHGNHDFIVQHGDAHRRAEKRLLHKRPTLVGATVTIGVFQHHDTIPLRLAVVMAAVVYALGHPEPTILVRVEVGRILEHRRSRPQRDLESVRRLQQCLGYNLRRGEIQDKQDGAAPADECAHWKQAGDEPADAARPGSERNGFHAG